MLARPRALDDLAEVWAYIAQDSESSADRFMARLDRQLQTLAHQPHAGRLRPELAPRLRSLPLGRFVVFYLPVVDGIDIIRVLHGSRDIDLIFTEE